MMFPWAKKIHREIDRIEGEAAENESEFLALQDTATLDRLHCEKAEADLTTLEQKIEAEIDYRREKGEKNKSARQFEIAERLRNILK